MAGVQDSSCGASSPEIVTARYIQSNSRPPLGTYSAWKVEKALATSSREEHVPLYLLVALAQQESSFDPHAINAASRDYGLFQVHYPFWKMFFRKRVGKTLAEIRPEDLLKISINTRMASKIIAYDIKISGGDWVIALGRYSGRTGESLKKYVAGIFLYSTGYLRYLKERSRSCREEERNPR